jgi:enoyl-CoA hydratase/carnithine racemase
MRLERQDRIGLLVLDQPPANTFDYAGLKQLASLIEDARYDENIRAVVITSALPRFFSAGADLKAFQAATPRQRAMTSLLGHEVFRKIEHTPMLIVAAMAGHTSGGGLELAMACDLRFAAEGDYKLGLAEVKLGLFPGMGGTQRLPRLVGLSRGLDLIATARSISPTEAHEIGLVDRLFSDSAACLAAAIEYATAIANGPSEAVGRAKIALRLGYGAPLDSGLALEREAIASVNLSDDAAEGIAAFVDKRQAIFRGH